MSYFKSLLRSSFCAFVSLWLNGFAIAADGYPDGQGWGQKERQDWYELSQGSRLIRTDWLAALKRGDGAAFLERATLEEYGYIYFPNSKGVLPVGFIEDVDRSGMKFVGFNCSACHTSKLKGNGAEIIVHGGQSMADFQAFTTDLIKSVETINTDEAAFDQFAQKVMGSAADGDQSAALRKDLQAWLDLRKTINDTANSSHWGRGRADAVGIILATTAMVVADPLIPIAEREPLPASNAPVSYPFVWNANQQARLQHNGVVDNGIDFGVLKVAKIGALIRNWTEALGVFADVKLDETGKKVLTSIRLDNLLRIEQALSQLQSPQWPAQFGTINRPRQARGAILFSTQCASCHGKLAANDTTTQLPLIDKPRSQIASEQQGFVYLQPVFDTTTRPSDFDKSINPSSAFIGTDPGMACNALLHTVPSGLLEGTKNVVGFLGSSSDRVFSERAVTTDLLRQLIQRDILANKVGTLRTIAENQLVAASERVGSFVLLGIESVFGGQGVSDDRLGPLREQLKYCSDLVSRARVYQPDNAIPVYKARPLNGIWATAPYLHNGSVPTLYDLLLPQDERPKTFGYFDGRMDLAKVGLIDASANLKAFLFRTYNDEGTVVLGNWNGGHEYGRALSHEARLDLVEYLKGL